MVRKIIATCIVILLFIQCNTGHKYKTESIELIEINLIDESKWEVPSAMHHAVKKIQILAEEPAKEDCKEKSKQLNQHIDEMVKSCTMEGQGHEEVHKLLIPILDRVKIIEKNCSSEKAANAYKDISRLLELYDLYFNEKKVNE
jgi:pyridoxal biosynthesis lyase PdxS